MGDGGRGWGVGMSVGDRESGGVVMGDSGGGWGGAEDGVGNECGR